jgi:glucuronate isomerase
MKEFMDKDFLLQSETAKILYHNFAKNMPIYDYHCHLPIKEIYEDRHFDSITELWLVDGFFGDHYKWRAMRNNGIDEKYITGDASDYEKFLAFATIMPKLIGNSVYYWAHLELKMIFGVDKQLCKDNAKEIYDICNEKLKSITTQSLLNKFKVEFLCTTDDPISPLSAHGEYSGIRVAPTFRPDRLFNLEEEYIAELSKMSNVEITDIKSLKKALEARIDYFKSKGCKISDHGMDYLPGNDVSEEEANDIFLRRNEINEDERFKFFSHMMRFLGKLYKEKDIVMQIHFATFRNINTKDFNAIGRDSGYDVIRHETYSDRLATFLNDLNNIDALPKIILYSLNSNACKEIATIAGSFRNVKLGPAWWLNDNLIGNREQMEVIAEYSTLGTFLGMLTDSRSFSSYVRFDFFRRILANYIGEYVERGEYDYKSAFTLMEDICYNNIKEFLKL